MKQLFITILLILGVLTNGLVAQNDKFEASLSESQVGIAKRFKVTFSLKGKGSNFQSPAFKHFEVLSGPNRSTSIRVINGDMSRSLKYSFILVARKKGAFEIAPAKIQSGGETLTTQPLEVKVVGSNQEAKDNNGDGKDKSVVERIKDKLFIRTIVDKTKLYQGEQITATFKLYSRVNISNYSLDGMPQFNGFWTQDLNNPKKLRVKNERYQGQRYKTAMLRQVALFPQKSGTLTIDPIEMEMVVRVRKKSNNNRHPFFNNLGNYENKKVNITSKTIDIDVQPLPTQGRPASFKGAVGNFDMNVNLDNRQVKTNESINLDATISGQGNLKLIDPFKINLPGDFEIYDPKINQNINSSGNKIKGSKKFKYVLIPRSPGTFKLAPLKFSYFHPDKEKYITHRTKEFTFNVREGAGTTTQAKPDRSQAKKEVEMLEEDIRYIKTNAGNLHQKGNTFIGSGLFWGLSIAPFLLFSGMLVYRRRIEALHQDEALFRSRKARKVAKKRLKTAAKYLQGGQLDAFYTEVENGIWYYAADKTGLEVAELTKDRLRQAMLGQQIPEHEVNRLVEVLDQCEQARFAPSLATVDQNNLYKEAENLLSTIEKSYQ